MSHGARHRSTVNYTLSTASTALDWRLTVKPCDGGCVRAPVDPALAAVLRKLRHDRGLSQEAVARRAEITKNAYMRIELGQASPAWSTVRRIADALEVTLEQLAAEVERS